MVSKFRETTGKKRKRKGKEGRGGEKHHKKGQTDTGDKKMHIILGKCGGQAPPWGKRQGVRSGKVARRGRGG